MFQVGISLDETVNPADLDDILEIFGSKENFVSLRILSYFCFQKCFNYYFQLELTDRKS